MTVVDVISEDVVECQWFWRGQFPDLRFYVEELTPCDKAGAVPYNADAGIAWTQNSIAPRNPESDSG